MHSRIPALCEADYVFPSPYQRLALTGNNQKWEENNCSPCPFPSLYQEVKSLSKALQSKTPLVLISQNVVMWLAVGDFFPLEKGNGIAMIGCDQGQSNPEAAGRICLPEPTAAQG